jgi:hypothetical protein
MPPAASCATRRASGTTPPGACTWSNTGDLQALTDLVHGPRRTTLAEEPDALASGHHRDGQPRSPLDRGRRAVTRALLISASAVARGRYSIARLVRAPVLP